MESPHANDPGVRWMLAYQNGSEPAFDEIVEAYSGQVWSLLTRFLGPSPDREDLVQETFLRVIRARGRYQPTARFSTFLYRIVFHLAVNRTERGRTELALDAEGPDPSLHEPAAAPGGEPWAELERGDAVAAVRGAIAALPEGQRLALILAKYEGLSHAEIATVMKSSEKAVKSMIHRARENLRVRLAPYFAEQELRG